MDTETRTASGHGIDAAGASSQRESSWADVETAQTDLQRRFRPLWWMYLGMFALLSSAYYLLFASANTAPMFLVLLVALFTVIPLVPSVRRVTTSTMEAGIWSALLPGIVVFASIYLAAFLRPGSGGSSPLLPLLGGIVMGALFIVAALLSELLHLRRIRTAGRRLASRMKPGRGVEVDFLRDPDTLGVMMRLSIPREIAISALLEDTGLSKQQLTDLLEWLREQGMAEIREHLFIGGRGSVWATTSPGGDRELAKHLATLRPTHAFSLA